MVENDFKIDSDDPFLYDSDLAGKLAFENFGIKYLFPWQRLVIANILEAYEYQKAIKGLSDEEKLFLESENSDSFCKGRQIVLLPTGAGKSLCFQIPALILDGPTLIIYPLLALMMDQMRRMETGSLESVIFRGGQTQEERSRNFEKIRNGAKIIIANPEVLKKDSLLNELSQAGIKHIAIDEAHCVSEWGNSFRPSYLELGKVIEKINPPLITAFTATASPVVLKNVSEILFKGEAHIVRSESDRPNIHYYVKETSAKEKKILELAKSEKKPMIVFCGTRNSTEDISQEINTCFGNETSKFYHAGLTKEEKDKVEKWFFNSKDGILCATCAYGMGVDKKDIKTVVHLDCPKTAEAYIQEAGRGGRDGSVAKAILLWSLKDSLNFSVFPESSREYYMKKFAETTVCRRQVLLDALGAEEAVCSGCDLCEAKQEEIEKPVKHKKFRLFYSGSSFQDGYEVSDWKRTYNIIKKNENFYSEDDIEALVIDLFNKDSLKVLGKKIWCHSDSVEIIRQLKETGKIEDSCFLWKGKLKTVKSK